MASNPVQQAMKEAMRRTYASGLEDGGKLILNALLDPTSEGAPSVVNDEVKTWARECLTRLELTA